LTSPIENIVSRYVAVFSKKLSSFPVHSFDTPEFDIPTFDIPEHDILKLRTD
jgi:hypothetical protein